MRIIGCVMAGILAAGTVQASNNPDQDAIDACIDQLRAVGGADGQGGEVLSSSFSQAGTEVVLQDRGGTVWRCIAYSDGAIGDLAVLEGADADALRGAASPPDPERIQFAAGTSGTEITRQLGAGEAHQYVLGAQAEQFLYVRVAPEDAQMYYIIRNPDGSVLLDGTDSETEYRGQLWQSGDHTVEVVNQESRPATFNLIVGIE